ncbi:hypothetical protein TorRG33x02_337920 [Trema orientale]|uniref:Uncharacterized protein n=1 Tax=Trema orientale TaxID=63057 RepID=A0A2P5AYB7_TREOI|nr:hypothetical protein TorRG33x02_337920 [Trema orientale]
MAKLKKTRHFRGGVASRGGWRPEKLGAGLGKSSLRLGWLPSTRGSRIPTPSLLHVGCGGSEDEDGDGVNGRWWRAGWASFKWPEIAWFSG